jgi:hypothetical protein
MFGDTYHNGLGPHFSEPSCVVAVTKVMDMIGVNLGTILILIDGFYNTIDLAIDDFSSARLVQ